MTKQNIGIIYGGRSAEHSVSLLTAKSIINAIDKEKYNVFPIFISLEGFLRGDKALLQTIGRAARNANGRVIMYADNITRSMKKAIDETNRRREIQMAYNEEHGIIPQTIIKDIRDSISAKKEIIKDDELLELEESTNITDDNIEEHLAELEQQMFAVAEKFEFEQAAKLRDTIAELKEKYKL